MSDEKTKDVFNELATMIRFTNAIFVKLNHYAEKNYPYELGIEKHPSRIELANIYRNYEVGRYFINLRTISEAMASFGVFMYN